MNSNRLVSIFVPYYNDEKFLDKTIQSILDQTYQNFELILFNHASTDNSKKIAHSYTDKRIKHIDSDINYGAGSGLNFWENLNSMKGDFVKVFCADDVMYPNHLEVLVNYLEENPEKDFVISDVDFINENENLLQKSYYSLFKFLNFNSHVSEKELLKYYFISYSPIPFIGALIKKEAFTNIYKDVSMIYLFDMSIWVELLIAGKKIGILEDKLSGYRQHDASAMSKNKNEVELSCYFEHLSYCELFYKIKDINAVKFICENNEFASELTENDIDLIPFVIAYQYFKLPVTAYNSENYMSLLYKNHAYMKLYKMLSDENIRTKIKDKFGFTIKDFRDLYRDKILVVNLNKYKKNGNVNFVQRIFSVKNDGIYKVLRILGFKIKMIRK